MRFSKVSLLFPIFFITTLSEDIFSKLHQNDYKLEYLRAETTRYDPAIYKYLKMITFKYNRTYAATNITVVYKVDLGSHLLDVKPTECSIIKPERLIVIPFLIVIQVYKFASNEYRPFPIRYRLNYCQLLANNVFGSASIMQSKELSACPIKKDVEYYTRNFHPDESKFPPLIPNGEYKVEMNFMIEDKEVALQNYYGVVYRPIKIPK